MGQREDLQTILEAVLGSDYVYFQPPESVKMEYPCIVYGRFAVDIKFADNSPYANKKGYQVTVIDKDPDSEIPDKVMALPLCSYQRFFTVDNLNHDIYNLYY